jgi:hypothetical protein
MCVTLRGSTNTLIEKNAQKVKEKGNISTGTKKIPLPIINKYEKLESSFDYYCAWNDFCLISCVCSCLELAGRKRLSRK